MVALVAATPIVGIPGVVLAHYTTSSASFCLTCHGTGDTPDRGVPSDVHPSFETVSCVDCHAKPGQIVFEGYVKGFLAEPERVASNCQRCHSTMANRTDQQGFKFNVRSITINHETHLQRGATCVTCHANVAHDLEQPKTNRPRMENCYSCHPRNDSCMKCHQGGIPPATPAREAIGRKPVAAPQPAAVPAAPSAEAKPAQTAAPAGSPTVTPAPKPAPAANTAEGKALFTQVCSACHGPDGGGLPSANLKSKAYLEGQGTEALVRATADGKGGMPAFGAAKGGSLQEGQIRSIVAYLLSVAN